MAAPRVSDNPEVQAHYATQVGLSAALLNALRRLWPQMEPITSSAQVRSAASAVIYQFSEASISLSADYYETLRDQAGVAMAFRTPIVDPLAPEQIEAYLESVAADIGSDFGKLIEASESAAQKVVGDAGRNQVLAAVQGDQAAKGFARVAQPGACAFCLTLAFRGAVYKSRATAGQVLSPNTTGTVNRYHENCNCGVQPLFDGEYELPTQLAAMHELYEESTATAPSGQLLNTFRNALAAHRGA